MKKAELVKKCQERMKSIRDKNYFTLRFGKTKKEIEQAKEMERRQKAEEYLKGFKDGKEYQIKLDELTFKSE
jgi:hypothetical protein